MSTVARGSKIFFPTTTMVVQPKGNFITSKGTVTFLVSVKQTKYEIKQYVKQLYGLEVIKVNTILHNGKMKRDGTGRWYKTPSYKKAIVTVDNTYFLDQQQMQLESGKTETEAAKE
jgi:ribosomal protein L23